MGARRWVPAGAAVLLVLGVLAARGGSAAAEEDLRPAVAEPGPSVAPSPGLDDPPLLLEADGVPGLRLGSAQDTVASTGVDLSTLPDSDGDGAATAADLPGGCLPVYRSEEEDRGFGTSGWVVDGVVSSVQMSRWEPGTSVLPGLQTWLGPTLGSPVQSASELPGARTTVERPFGSPGPAVTVVHVPLQGTEAVLSDATSWPTSPAGEPSGRITTIELRHPRARGCSQEALSAAGPLLWGEPEPPTGLDLVIGPDGVAAFPLGTPAEALEGVLGVHEDGGTGSCRSFGMSPGGGEGFVRVVTLDGVVVQAEGYGPVPTSLGVGHGAGEADVRAALPALAERYRGPLPREAEAELEGRVLSVGFEPETRFVPDVDVPVQGGPPLLARVGVRAAGVPSELPC